MKTTLVIMAAGIGSRYGGGIKQLATVGSCGEILMDYSIYDAIEAGFDKIVFVIRHDIEKDFREIIGDRIEKVCKVEYVFQELSKLPEGFTLPEGRTKPWGTGHAILCCKGVVNEPFAVINADDFYGKEAFCALHTYLCSPENKDFESDICLAGYILKNTLSENGGVTRGICNVDGNMCLSSISETKNIRRENGKVLCGSDNTEVSEDSFVSMNMWGFRPDFINKLEKGFVEFLESAEQPNMTGEFLLPIYADDLISQGKASPKLLPTNDKWFGLTYKEDLPSVREAISKLTENGTYPENIMQALMNR